MSLRTEGHDDQAAWRPLAGLRVLDVGRWVAAPFAARLLGDLGAAVERIEPTSGDPLLELDEGATSVARCAYDYVNAAKPRHREADVGDAVRRRAASFDVLICDLAPREQAVAGLDPPALRLAHPSLVVGVVTGYGLSGPHADRAWSELTAYHAGSEAAVLPGPRIYEGFPDRPPVRGGRYLAEYDAGLSLSGGVIAALVRRATTGMGDLIEVSAQEVEIGLNRTTISRGLNEGRDYDRRYEGYGWQGTLRARDGWVCLRPNEDRHWQAFTRVIGRPQLAYDPRFATYDARFANGAALLEELERWTRQVDRSTIRAAMIEAGVPGAPYLEPAEILEDAAVRSREVFVDWPGGGRAPRHPLRLSGEAPPVPDGVAEAVRRKMARAGQADGPLAGLRILDLTWVASGPYATLLLSSLGADVIKVESPDRPDLFRRSHGSDDDVDAGLRFVDLNQGKRSIAMNLKTAAGHDELLALAGTCDVLVENYRPGVRDRLAIGDRALWARNPALIIVSLSGFGMTSSDRNRPGYASVFSAESGISTMTGYPDAPPTDVRDSNDLRGGTATFVGVVAGLYGLVLGRGATSIDLAMRDVLISLQGDAFLQASRGGHATRSANAMEGCTAYDCYLAADGRWVAISARTTQERRALAGVAFPSLPFAPGHDAGLIDRAVSQWVGERSGQRVIDALAHAAVPAALTASVSDIGADPHLAARRVIRDGEHPRLGKLRFVSGPIRSHAATRDDRAIPSPLLGEHTEEIRTELARYRGPIALPPTAEEDRLPEWKGADRDHDR